MPLSMPGMYLHLSLILSLLSVNCAATEVSSLGSRRSILRQVNTNDKNGDLPDYAFELNATNFDAVLKDTPATFSVVEFFAHCCGLWVLLRSLPVRIEDGESQFTFKAMCGFVHNFFICEECRQHFYKSVQVFLVLSTKPVTLLSGFGVLIIRLTKD